jgi:transcriptional regulator with XRE-family HTH domain
MSKISEILKNEREKKGLELKDISKALKISVDFLEKIESGKIKELPSYVHALGFIKSYGKYLGLDVEEIEKLFKEEHKKEDFLKNYITLYDSEKTIKIKENKRRYPLVLAVIAILLIISGYIYYKEVSRDNMSQKIDNSNSSIIFLDNVTLDNVAEEDNSSENLKSDSISNKSNGNDSAIDYQAIAREILNNDTNKDVGEPNKLKLVFNDTCWIHFKADNSTVYDFIAEKDMVKVVSFYDYFVIDIGNAAALTIVYNDQTIRNFGGFREAVKNLYFYLNDNGTLIYKR